MSRKYTAVLLSAALALSAAFAASGCGSGSEGTGAAARTSAQAAEQRAREGEVVVSDRVEFSRPEIYEFAWITTADWRRTGPKTLLLEKNGVQLEAVIECAVPWWIAAEPLGEKLPVKLDPVRVSLTAEHPVSTLNFRVRFRPVSASKPLSKKE